LAETAPNSAGAIAPVGTIEITYALHFAPAPRGEVAKQAQELLRSKYPALVRLGSREETANRPAVYVAVLDMKAKHIDPPSLETLRYSGRGVTKSQAEAMQKSTIAVGLTFRYRASEAIAAIAQANAMTHDLALLTAGLIWDVETRELFAPQAWAERRLSPPDHGFPNVRDHITIHAYQSGEYIRAITLGMRKFGLPDLVVNQFPWSMNNQMGNTINLFAQSLVEGSTPPLGAYDFDVSKVRHDGARAAYSSLLDGAKPVASLTLVKAVAEEGDPDNRLVEIRFDRYAGTTVHEKRQKFVSAFYGSSDSITPVKHDDAIRAASERARKHLPALRTAFNAGLEPGERILVKAPFGRPDGGNEFMWVEVSSWKGEDIVGLLDNEPYYIPTLHAGSTVKVSEREVFDYLRYKADGTAEGNDTGKEIEKAQGHR
jgi:uncharacterized protein YegJ (DUF2314 family)